jgi:HTH-type transcriptional regulator / antitoxin HigA
MSQAELSTRTGLSTKHINQMVQGVAALSHDTAIALERATGVPASMWNTLESRYRDYLARKRERERLGDHKSWLSAMPVKFLRKHGYVTADNADEPAVIQQVLRFFGVVSVEAWDAIWLRPTADFLQSQAFSVDSAALATWLRLGELQAQRIHTSPYNRESLRAQIQALRSLSWRSLDHFLPELKRICAESGVALVIIPEVPGCRTSGATRWLSPHKAVLQLSLRHKRNDHLWFAFFHELGHILLHGKRDQFIDDEDSYEEGDDPKERDANKFAADTLIPAVYIPELRRLRSLASVTAFAQKVGVAPGIVVGRLHHDGVLAYNIGHRLFERYKLRDE